MMVRSLGGDLFAINRVLKMLRYLICLKYPGTIYKLNKLQVLDNMAYKQRNHHHPPFIYVYFILQWMSVNSSIHELDKDK